MIESFTMNKNELYKKIEQGLKPIEGKTILHTAPHHDDIILGYHAYAMRNLEKNQNYIVYMTNGTNGVADEYVIKLLQSMSKNIQTSLSFVLERSYQQLLLNFAQAYRSQDHEQIQQARELVVLKIMTEVFGCCDVQQFQAKVDWLQDSFVTKESDQLDHELIRELKGRIRQSESDCKWSIEQGHSNNVKHFDAEFYYELSDDAVARDVQKFVDYLHHVKPDIITVAMDPCGVGPSTHFVTLQVIVQALQKYGDTSIEILGYRNVWGSFTLEAASMIVPLTRQEMDQMQSIFSNCFDTQKNPLFPSPLFDGSFCQLTTHLQEHHWQDVKESLSSSEINLVSQYQGALLLKRVNIQEIIL